MSYLHGKLNELAMLYDATLDATNLLDSIQKVDTTLTEPVTNVLAPLHDLTMVITNRIQTINQDISRIEEQSNQYDETKGLP